MGVVYKARHVLLKKLVALKLLSPRLKQTPEGAARFRREIDAAGRLEHPNLVRAYDAGETEGVPFLVMELQEPTSTTWFSNTTPCR
jgi:serine/threonine-protein kinase